MKKLLIIIISFVSIILINDNIFATFLREAEEYRSKGFRAMTKGDLDRALVYYQKAINLEPFYAEAHSDLGIVYEKMGWLNRAEESYRTALRIRPDYAPAYSNLALLYERRGDIERAVFYYKARIAFGRPEDAWTKKAWDRLAKHRPEEVEKLEAHKLLEDMIRTMRLQEQQMVDIAEKHFQKASEFFSRGKKQEALNEIEMARKFAPQDPKMEMFKRRIVTTIVQGYYMEGIGNYQKGDYERAYEYFSNILNLISQGLEKSRAE